MPKPKAQTQKPLPFASGVMFGRSFMADHAGSLMTDGRLAVAELIANSYDAGARCVRVNWPSEGDGPFSIEDDGTGMTLAEFQRRWQTLGYNRQEEQGRWASLPQGEGGDGQRRLAFGQSGKGRHGAFCFSDSYVVSTWRDGTCLTAAVRLTPGGREPFEFGSPRVTSKPKHGTKVSAEIRRNFVSPEAIGTAIGSKFLVDPAFQIVFNGTALTLLNLDTARTVKVDVEECGEIEIIEIDPQASDRTTHLRGITWWVHGRMVGSPSWEGLDNAGAVLDGRTSVAKRLSFVVMADVLKPHVKADWSGFHATEQTIAVQRAAREHVIRALESHLSSQRQARKRTALSETASTLMSLPPPSQRAAGAFADQIIANCPSISQGDLSRAVTVFAKLEQARTGYELLAELAGCSPNDLDRWRDIMRRWRATDAEKVLNELHWRLDLIRRLEEVLQREKSDELHDLQPLFEHGLWIFGPEYESPHFRSNRSLTTVIRELLGKRAKEPHAQRPDFVALPDRSIGVYSADGFDQQGEVAGIAKVLIVELKHGTAALTRAEVSQPEDYVTTLRSGNYVQQSTRFDVFVLGSSLAADGADERALGNHTAIRPMTYSVVLRRAHARTFNLLGKVKESFPESQPDPDVAAAVAAERTMFDPK